MDIVMPRMDGLEATRQIKAVQPETKVIILAVHDEELYRKAAHESGADASLLKETLVAELIPTIRVLVPNRFAGQKATKTASLSHSIPCPEG